MKNKTIKDLSDLEFEKIRSELSRQGYEVDSREELEIFSMLYGKVYPYEK